MSVGFDKSAGGGPTLAPPPSKAKGAGRVGDTLVVFMTHFESKMHRFDHVEVEVEGYEERCEGGRGANEGGGRCYLLFIFTQGPDSRTFCCSYYIPAVLKRLSSIPMPRQVARGGP